MCEPHQLRNIGFWLASAALPNFVVRGSAVFENRTAAVEVLAVMAAVIERLEQSLYTIHDLVAEAEYKEYKAAIGGVMAEIYIRARLKIYQAFPDLEPKI